jgi:hypothetical protein
VTLIIWGVVISAAIGGVVAFAAPRLFGPTYQVTRFEFAVGFVLCALLVVPAVTVVGSKVAMSNNLSFNEYWNGWEEAAVETPVRCVRDGVCRWTYDCDRYTVQVPVTTTDSKGNSKTTYRTEVRYHECPYVNYEYSYRVDTSVGSFTLAEHRFGPDPDADRYRPGDSLRGVERRAGIGPPQEWLDAKARIDAGTPGPATVVKPYDNYILASQHSTLRKLSGDIERYDAAGLIPDPASGLISAYRADKTHLVDDVTTTVGLPEWRDAVDTLSAELGTERQGDLHLVAVPAAVVDDPDSYTAALMASWTSPERGDSSLAKNTVVTVVGVDGDGTVEWARLDTGMPVGNEALAAKVRDQLPGTEFAPDALVGLGENPGVLTELLLADGGGFERVCMLCDDESDDGAGFGYLSGEIRPNAGQNAVILFVAALFATGIWAAFAGFAVGPVNARRGDSTRPTTRARYRP